MVFQLCLNGKLDFQKLSNGKIKKSLQILIQEQKDYLKKEGIDFEKQPDSVWPLVKLREVCVIKTGKKDVNHSKLDGKYIFFTCASNQFKSPDYAFDTEAILLPGNGVNVGKVFYYKGKFQVYQRTYVLFNFINSLSGKYIYYHFTLKWNQFIKDKQYGSATNYIVLSKLQNFLIPLPPLEVQKEIVALMKYMENIKKQIQKEKNLSVQLSQSLSRLENYQKIV